MSNALIHYAGHFSTRWLPLLLLAPVTPAAAAEALDYSYVELGYAIDSTIETYGKSYDSDSSFRVNASYLFDRHFFLSAQFFQRITIWRIMTTSACPAFRWALVTGAGSAVTTPDRSTGSCS